MQANRIDSSCPLPSVSVIDKKERGFCASVTAKMESSNIIITRWKDNSVVTVASTVDSEQPLGSVKRWSKKDMKHVQIPIPKSIQNYNKCMGGTDQMDQNVNNYCIGIRGKKWWWCLFTWLLDIAMQNAWQLARLKGTTVDQLSFRREVPISYLLRFQDLQVHLVGKTSTPFMGRGMHDLTMQATLSDMFLIRSEEDAKELSVHLTRVLNV